MAFRLQRCLIFLVAVHITGWRVLAPALAQDPAKATILEVMVPPGEKQPKVYLNGVEKREATFRILGAKPDGWHRTAIKAVFADGASLERQVQFQGGWHVTVPFMRYKDTRPELVVQSGHSDAITGLAASPDGKYLVSAGSGDRTAILWDLSTGRQLRTLAGHLRWVNAAAFAPDGRTVALGIGDGTVAIYDPVAGRRLRTITPDPKETDNEVRSLAFSRDGKKLLIGGRGKAWLWDLTVNRALAVLSGLKGFVVSVAFHPREATILTVTRDEGKSWKGSAALWNTQTGKMIGVIQGHQDYVRCAVFSRDGSQMLTGGDDGLATLWSTEPFAPKKTFEVGKASVARVAFTHDPGRIVTAGSDGAVTLWSTASGKKISTLGKHTDEVLCLTTSLDGRLVFTGSMDCEVIQWDVAGSRPPRTLRSRPDRPYGLAFSPDGKRLASSAGSDLALIWNPASAVMMRPLEGHRKVVRAAEFSPKGEYVLTCSDDQSVRLWDSTSGQLIGRPWMGHADTVMSARFSPDGRRVVTAGRAKRNPNGSIVQQGEAILWETPSGRSLQMFQGHVGNIWDAVFSSDGKRLVTCGEDKTAIVRDLATGHILATLKGHTDMVVSAFFTPDGSQVVTAAGPKHDTRAILWDVASAKPIREFPGHRLGLSAVVPVPGGKRFVSVSFDGTACLWNLATGEKLRTFTGHTGPADGIAVHPSGRFFATSAGDGTIRYWDLATGEELAWFVSLDRGADWIVVTPDGLFDGSARGRENFWFRLNNQLELVQLDRFFRDFARPGLLARLWAGKRELPPSRLGQAQSPLVKIVTPTPTTPVRSPEFTLDVEIHDRGGGIGAVHLRHSGSQFAIAPFKKEKEGNVWKYQYKVDLAPQENTIEVQAESEQPGAPESEAERLVVYLQQPRHKGRLHLLAVGVSQYADKNVPALRFARIDAEAMNKVFAGRGPQLFQEVVVHTLGDGEATRAAILKVIDDIAAQASVDDTVVLFFAGHGVMDEGRFYFLPHDYEAKAGPAKTAGLQTTALSGKAVIEGLLKTKALNRLVVLDACHSGAVIEDLAGLASQADHLTRRTGIFFLVGAMAGQIAEESQSLGHGVLTYTFLAAVNAVKAGRLKNAPLTAEYATALSLVNYVTQRVPELLGPGHDIPIITATRNFEVLPVGKK